MVIRCYQGQGQVKSFKGQCKHCIYFDISYDHCYCNYYWTYFMIIYTDVDLTYIIYMWYDDLWPMTSECILNTLFIWGKMNLIVRPLPILIYLDGQLISLA